MGQLRSRIAVPVLAALLIAPAALATAPKKGGSYRGKLAAPLTKIAVTFKTSANGKKVTALRISDLPVYCSSGGGPPIPIKFASATVTGAGTFKSTGKQTISTGPLKGQTGATLSITGTFLASGKERGTVRTTFSRAPACSGSSSYTAHT